MYHNVILDMYDNVIPDKNQRRSAFKGMHFQPTLSDAGDQEMDRMISRVRLTTAAQYYDKDE